MVGIGKGIGHDPPGIVPAVAAFVEQDAHQLGDCHGRVGIVDMDGDLIRKVIERRVLPQMTVHNILHGCRYKEILLAQPQALALRMVIRRVEHLADDFRHRVLLHGAHIVALIEERHVEARGFRGPQAQYADPLAILAGDEHVVWNRHDRLIIFVLRVVIGAVPLVLNLALKAHFDGALLLGDEPYLAAGQPEIRQLRLPAVHDLLLENAVFVEDRITGGKIPLRGKAVEVAGGKPSQASIAEARVRLAVIEAFHLDIVVRKRLAEYLGQAEIV